VSIDRGERHPINQRQGPADLSAMPPPVPLGMAELAEVARRIRLELPEPPKALVLECGHAVMVALSARQPGRPEVMPHTATQPGVGLTYRQIQVQERDGWGLRWRLLEDGEVVGEGELGVQGS